MNNIVERVARALCTKWSDDPDASVDWGPLGRRQGAKWETFLFDAIVDIKAYNEAPAADGLFITGEGEIQIQRDAPTIEDLCARFAERCLADPPDGDESKAKLRPATRRNYRILIDKKILPHLRGRKVAEITFEDVDRLHRAITECGASYTANRVVAVLHKVFNYAIHNLNWRKDNPATGIKRNPEVKRRRYLSGDELARLTIALSEQPDQQAANIVRLLLLTGARRGEVLSATWDQFDFEAGDWIKPGSTTKQRTEHRVPLSAPVRQLLSEIKAGAKMDSPYVFPGRISGHRVEIKERWRALCKAAGIVTVETVRGVNGREKTVVKPSARIHDLRHTYASVLASDGLSLSVIGALLGHSQPATTQRYAHLFDDPLRKAAERAAEVISRPDGRADHRTRLLKMTADIAEKEAQHQQ